MPKQLYSDLVSHARNTLPNEACGLISGKWQTCITLWPMKNIEPSPYSFAMDLMEQESVFRKMKRKKERFLAIYHSHPYGIPLPSKDDIQSSVYPEVYHFIVAVEKKVEKVKCYKFKNGKANAVNIKFL
ncbi:Mov34/MPN/PAD-1 family protein [Rossellomorea sp. KS-H15a]|uniref:Mov34/MPN/PAD-1 family protein n=1 Tax=Rossellomorea sp. KS-H15a TaxID=2963940 RepID=UPI0020C63337|nr:M67 family metallopeptidase [Rossellomorea sp. KS-H15a]UTE79420.1 M67 family metallopeptidase [Rossellomorea sp. KS-H15a]